VSKNTKLEELRCANNKLKSLNVSKNTKLEELRCANNKLTKLDISKNKKLKKLYCNGNSIKNPAKLIAWLEEPGHSGKVMPQK